MDSVALCTVISRLAMLRNRSHSCQAILRGFDNAFTALFRQIRYDIADNIIPQEKRDQLYLNVSWCIPVYSRIFPDLLYPETYHQIKKLHDTISTRLMPVTRKVPDIRLSQILHNCVSSKFGGRRSSRLISAVSQSVCSMKDRKKKLFVKEEHVNAIGAAVWSLGQVMLNISCSKNNQDSFGMSIPENVDKDEISSTSTPLPHDDASSLFSLLKPSTSTVFSEALQTEDLDVFSLCRSAQIAVEVLQQHMQDHPDSLRKNPRALAQSIAGVAAMKWFLWSRGVDSPGFYAKSVLSGEKVQIESDISIRRILETRLANMTPLETIDALIVALSDEICFDARSNGVEGQSKIGANDVAQILPVLSTILFKCDEKRLVKEKIEKVNGLVWYMLADTVVRNKSQSHQPQATIDDFGALSRQITSREVISGLFSCSVALMKLDLFETRNADFETTIQSLNVANDVLLRLLPKHLDLISNDELKCLVSIMLRDHNSLAFNNSSRNKTLTQVKQRLKKGIISELVHADDFKFFTKFIHSSNQI
eukprot:GDKJ01002002.1.p1 GENE.GDKJ01002002.1~~GDKJ01002002.1.p1  ORF type:complete len:628 (+),score=95.21 GDKJ01002002.1:277-1884(+)